jgi:hypothetical protein
VKTKIAKQVLLKPKQDINSKTLKKSNINKSFQMMSKLSVSSKLLKKNKIIWEKKAILWACIMEVQYHIKSYHNYL